VGVRASMASRTLRLGERLQDLYRLTDAQLYAAKKVRRALERPLARTQLNGVLPHKEVAPAQSP
jgi:hypothetical protein